MATHGELLRWVPGRWFCSEAWFDLLFTLLFAQDFRTIFSAFYSQQTTKQGARVWEACWIEKKAAAFAACFREKQQKTAKSVQLLRTPCWPSKWAETSVTAREGKVSKWMARWIEAELWRSNDTKRLTDWKTARTITQSKCRTYPSDCECCCIFTQVAVRETKAVP